MTKEQKILLLFVLLIAGSGATIYVSKSNTATPVVSTVPQTNSETNTATKLTTTTELAPTTSETAVSATVMAPKPTPVPVVQNKTLVHNQEYIVPDGDTENITITVIVDVAGNIVDVKFAYGTPTNRESKEFLGRFNTAFSAKTLVGTKIGDIKLSRVGGSSLTTGAFNKAMATLATKVTS